MRLFALIVFAAASLPAETLDGVLARMNTAATNFKSQTAKVRRLIHTAVINESETESGTMRVRREKGNDFQVLIEITGPQPKAAAFNGRKVEVYYPKIATVQEFDAGKNRDMLVQFFLLGFASTRDQLERDYTLKLLPPENIGGSPAAHLELVPKSKQLLQHFKRAELWIGSNGYPAQQKFHQSGGDYQMVTYSDVRINVALPDNDLRLKLPPGVKREYPQR
ncbi:MAG: LolA family protein [Bryobacteraceae bacterium]